MPLRTKILPCVILALSLARPAAAAWPQGGLGVCTEPNIQGRPMAAPDGAGGAIIVWHDDRNGGSGRDIYAQRVDASGVPQWTADGVPVCTAAANQSDPRVIPDGAGGVIIAWHDYQAFHDVYAQRLNGAGVPQWTANGVALTNLGVNQSLQDLAPDGSGGAIVVWEDMRSGTYTDVYVQRVTAAGSPAWTANGVAVCTATDSQSLPVIAADGLGGAVVAWRDLRAAWGDIYAQRVNASGNVLWTANGNPVRVVAGSFAGNPAIRSLGPDGVVIAWSDNRDYTDYDVYAQRLMLNGSAQWTANGLPVGVALGDQYFARVVPDGSGGVIIGWADARYGNANVFAQRLTIGGVEQWASGGSLVSFSSQVSSDLRMIADGAGGAVFAWDDWRAWSGDAVYAQRIDASGSPTWATGDVRLSGQTTGQYPQLVSDGAGGAVLTWHDNRTGIHDVYAQRVERYGNWGFPAPEIAAVRDIPGDQGGQVNLSWEASRLDPWPTQQIYQYSIWRAISPSAAHAALSSGAALVGDGVDPLSTGPDVVRVQQVGGSTYYWKYVMAASAWGLDRYSENVPTLFDQTVSLTELHYFQVIAHAYTGFWASAPDSGYSVDDLSPAAPLALTANRSGGEVLLTWRKSREADLRDYAVYRGTASGVSPVPSFFLSSATDTFLTDVSAPAGVLYYVVTAIDVHANPSPPSNEATVPGSPTGITPGTPAISALTVRPNSPNPFTGTTDLEIGLPVASRVDVEVYDVAGRRVRALSANEMGAGWQRMTFDGRDDQGRTLASGVYFYRVRANGTAVTNKMVIAR